MTDLAVLVAFLPFLLFGERRSPQKAVANSSSSSKKEKKKELQQRSFDKAAAAYLAGPDKQANRLNWLGAAEEPISSPALQMASIFHSRLFFQLYKTYYLHSITLKGP